MLGHTGDLYYRFLAKSTKVVTVQVEERAQTLAMTSFNATWDECLSTSADVHMMCMRSRQKLVIVLKQHRQQTCAT